VLNEDNLSLSFKTQQGAIAATLRERCSGWEMAGTGKRTSSMHWRSWAWAAAGGRRAAFGGSQCAIDAVTRASINRLLAWPIEQVAPAHGVPANADAALLATEPSRAYSGRPSLAGRPSL
jgi:hypothetical protein